VECNDIVFFMLSLYEFVCVCARARVEAIGSSKALFTSTKNPNFFKIFYHIKSLDTCMEY